MGSAIFEHCRESGYPGFAPAFEKEISSESSLKAYLILLSARSRGAMPQTAMQIVTECAALSPDPDGEIVALFADYNWRPQLIGATALLVRPDLATDETLSSLWAALDAGSWVSPQLVATAYLRDPTFERNARLRIEAGCPINPGRLGSLDWAARHSAAGPGSFTQHFHKALAALITLCRHLPSNSEEASWLRRVSANSATQAALQQDRDGGDHIAIRWLAGVEALLIGGADTAR